MQPSYDDLLKTNQELLKINAELQKTIAILTERISKLEEQLKINSKNSSKPPASDQKPNSDDPPRKGGAIRGHKGLFRTLIENPTSVHERKLHRIILPSIAEHVKFCENLPRPWGKAKYYLMTDSALVS